MNTIEFLIESLGDKLILMGIMLFLLVDVLFIPPLAKKVQQHNYKRHSELVSAYNNKLLASNPVSSTSSRFVTKGKSLKPRLQIIVTR